MPLQKILHTSEMLKKLDLAESTLSEDFFAEDIGDFFDRDSLSRLVIRCCAALLFQHQSFP